MIKGKPKPKPPKPPKTDERIARALEEIADYLAALVTDRRMVSRIDAVSDRLNQLQRSINNAS